MPPTNEVELVNGDSNSSTEEVTNCNFSSEMTVSIPLLSTQQGN